MKLNQPLLLASLVCSTLSLHAQNAFIKEEVWPIKTYPFSDPDPVPMLARNPRIYPYFAFDDYSENGVRQNWKVIRLENEHLQVFVLPEVGGKVFGAREKATGKEFIYMNDALKFRRIALRGPWTSGGIEFNFGLIGHTPSTATPVDYALRTNDDGSVTCFVGAMDLPSRTRWTVAITLPKDKAYFETAPLWYNFSPFEQSYYVWITAAMNAREDLQYFYPGRYMVPHSYDIANATWPRDAPGRDLSWYKYNRFESHKSYFVFGDYREHFAGYWHDAKLGLGHWARYDDMPGQKIWFWSLFRDGGIWENLLTDNKGQYSEPQAGRLLSQVDHEFFAPYSGDAWRELWFPIKEIGGVVAASPFAAMNVEIDGDSIHIGICAVQDIEEELRVAAGGKQVFARGVKLKPLQVQRGSFKHEAEHGALQFTLGDKLSYTNDETANDLRRPQQYQPILENTAEGLYLAGEFHEKQREYEIARQKYAACLLRDANHIRAMTRLALLHGRRGEYERGLEYAAAALKLSMYDPAANYAYGVLARRLGRLIDAKETLGWAARAMAYRSNAYCQLAEIYLLEKNFATALEYAERALDFNKFNLNAYEAQALALRKLEQREEAQAVWRELLQIDPLNHLARFELYLLESNAARLQEFQSMIRNELPHESYLEMAINYVKLGCEEEARALLQNAPRHPMIHYWQAYLLRESDATQSAVHLQQAASLSPALVFPFREESLPVLQWASEANATSWKPKYYLGLLLWSKERKAEALRSFNACGEPGFAAFYIARARLQEELGEKETFADYQRAKEAGGNEWRAWHFLIDQYARRRRNAEALQTAQQAAQKFPKEIVLTMDYAGALFNNARYAECVARLRQTRVLPYEGSWEAHDLFLRAQVHWALEQMKKKDFAAALQSLSGAKTYPEHLGTGMPEDPDFRLQDYLMSVCHAKLKQSGKAREARTRVQELTQRHWLARGQWHYFAIRALRQSGEHELAEKLKREWHARDENDWRMQWALARLNGDHATANAIAQAHSEDEHFMMGVAAAAMSDE